MVLCAMHLPSNHQKLTPRINSMYTELAELTTSNIRRTLAGNKIVDHSDVVGASPVGAAPTTSSLSTYNTWLQYNGQMQLQDETKTFMFGDWVRLILGELMVMSEKLSTKLIVCMNPQAGTTWTIFITLTSEWARWRLISPASRFFTQL